MFGLLNSLRQAVYIFIYYWIACQLMMTVLALLYIGYAKLTKAEGDTVV